MLTIIINWIYIVFTCFCIGFFFVQLIGRHMHYFVKRIDSILVTGLIIATVYAQTFSLFYRVSAEANAVLLIFSVGICIAMRKQMVKFLRESMNSTSLSCKILILFLFLLWSFFTSRGYMVLDMDLYHGQSIRWIEEYGVVKGLGNLHSRFGYNSSLFAVSALYSMKFLMGRSLHTVNGLIAFILCLTVLDLKKAFQRRKMLLSDYARVGAVYYLTTIYDEIIAPSSDYAVMCIIFFIVIKWLVQLEKEEQERNHIVPYALLCVASVYVLTLKLTAGLILILTVKPAYMLIKEKKWKEIGIFLVLGLITAVPWMARTVIITGWLFYPFAELDLFTVDWKIFDEGLIRSDAYLIKTWAKGANELADTSLRSWFPHWFQSELAFTERILIIADLGSCIAGAVMAIVIFAKKKWQELDLLVVLAAVGGSYLFWQFTAPMMRYGYAHVLLLPTLAGGYIVEKVKLKKVVYLAFIVYGIYKIYVCCDYIALFRTWPNYVWQETYDTYDLESYEIDGVTFYYAPDGDATGYDPFPSSPTPADIKLRGEGLKDGFRSR